MKALTITVLGATGNIGQHLLPLLLAQGHRVRAVARDPGKLAAARAQGAQALTGDVLDAAFLTEALRGADAVFAMIPPHYGAADFRGYQNQAGEAIAQAIRAGGVRRVVNLSSFGAHLPAGTGPILGLHDQEKRLDAIPGLALTHLRPAYFMENAFFGAGLVKGQGIYGSPIQADVSFPQIATRDIAAAAARALTAAEGPRVQELLGPTEVTMADVTATLRRVLGKESLPYVVFPYAAAEEAMLGSGMSASAARAFTEMYTALNEGTLRAQFPRDAAATTPTTLEAFLTDVAPAFA